MAKENGAVHILLVEDNSADVFLLEKALCSHNLDYSLTRYEDGERAIKALSDGTCPKPDMILLDLNLPRRDGFEVLKAIRSHPWLVGVPVGILTSSEAARDRYRVTLMGVERYIHKPPTLEQFIDQVGGTVVDMLSQ